MTRAFRILLLAGSMVGLTTLADAKDDFPVSAQSVSPPDGYYTIEKSSKDLRNRNGRLEYCLKHAEPRVAWTAECVVWGTADAYLQKVLKRTDVKYTSLGIAPWTGVTYLFYTLSEPN